MFAPNAGYRNDTFEGLSRGENLSYHGVYLLLILVTISLTPYARYKSRAVKAGYAK